MPLPILHSAAGYGIYRISRCGMSLRAPKGRSNLVMLLCMLMACLPDFDFIPGILLGRVNEIHRLAGHSLFAAIVCGTLAAIVVATVQKKITRHCEPEERSLPRRQAGNLASLAGAWSQISSYFFLFASCFSSHIILDYFNGPPKGVALFWPFSSKMYYAPFSLYGFKGVRSPLEDAAGLGDLLNYVFSQANFYTIIFELSVLFSMITFVRVLKHENNSAMASQSVVFGSMALFFITLWTLGGQ